MSSQYHTCHNKMEWAERMNKMLMESARSMMLHAKLPDKYWAEAVATAAYIKNRTPANAIKQNKTPFERWYGKKPNVSNLKVFGCITYAHVPDSQRQKLDKKSKKLRFVGYSLEHKGYRLISEETLKVIIHRDAVFNETALGHEDKADNKVVDIVMNDHGEDKSEIEEIELKNDKELEHQRPERRICPPVTYGIEEYADTAKDYVNHVTYCHNIEPKTMVEALNSEHGKEGKEAADSEYLFFIENKTWELVKLPKSQKAIGCK